MNFPQEISIPSQNAKQFPIYTHFWDTLHRYCCPQINNKKYKLFKLKLFTKEKLYNTMNNSRIDFLGHVK